jgi:hypothetical protein
MPSEIASAANGSPTHRKSLGPALQSGESWSGQTGPLASASSPRSSFWNESSPLPFSQRAKRWTFVMSREEEYRSLAEECLRIAQTMRNQEARTALLEMAEAWQRLAEEQRASAPPDEIGRQT